MPVAPGTRLGPYEIVSRLGAGGMGEVWRARDTRLDRSVAIKVLPAELAASAQLRTRFEREAKAISQLDHPNICTLYDVGDDYLVMELLEGETLAERIARGPLPLDQALRAGVEIAGALDRAHRQHLVHRDLKPSNVMLTKHGAKLLDFGLAKPSPLSIGADALTMQKSLTAEGTIVGTFQYMAPEQLEGQEVDQRTDIFAFGCVLYEMMTGRRAFEGRTRTSVIAAIVSGEPTPIRTLQPLTPPMLEHIIHKCMAKDPAERWQSAYDIGEELRWLRDSGASAALAAVPAIKRSRRSRWLVTTLAVVALAAVATSAWMLRRPEREPHLALSVAAPADAGIDAFTQAAFSPDGNRIVFAARSAAQHTWSLWIRDLDKAEPRELPGTAGARQPFWSPDGKNIAYFAEGKLKRIPAAGGPPETICPAPAPTGGSWGGHDTIVFNRDSIGPLYRVDARGGTAVALTKVLPREEGHRWPSFLPDGEHFLFLGDSSKSEDHWIRIGSLLDGQVRDLFHGITNARYVEPGWILFVRSGSLMAQRFDAKTLTLSGEPRVLGNNLYQSADDHLYEFSAAANGRLLYRSADSSSRYEWWDRQGHFVQRVGEPHRLGSGYVSPDGRYLAFTQFDTDGRGEDIWMLDLTRNALSRLTTDPAAEILPVWTEDGTQIAYASMRSGIAELYLSDVRNPAAVRRLFGAPDRAMFPTSSGPGGTIIFDYSKPLENDIWMYSLRSGKAEPYLSTPGDENDGQLSGDGRQIAYVSTATGRPEIYAERFPTHEGRRMISTNGGLHPAWRGDGKELYYVAQDGMLMSVDMTSETSAPQPLFQTDGAFCTPSRDGQRFLVAKALVNGEAEPLTVVTNWDLLP